ncbi:hypothetical protein TanjilG_22533 [Lupinus angustifolius]|uniref:dolichyl-P-Man:Man5GlcNAc2-PP-dolichol alpha-1,3-mannosyltransferase n=1 Tax=Lupinus angustifolius TaxID=3871 RepID=A0A4P1RSZ9_LUPAN|nr:hypothetical protein TanjilG_22533 [Lupinus angustifolius]
MAAESVTQSSPPSHLHIKSTKAFFKNPKIPFAVALLFADAILVFLIITFVPYTKIDWDAYMSQVSGFLKGERDYRKLEGDTGPLVYPAGFLYVYSAFQFFTAGQVYPAQVPWWALCLLSLSKRVHSIFVLRLFNDCVAMTLLHAALLLLMHRRWNLGLIVFSAAVSIKMNVLLYAPPLLLLMLKAMDISGVLLALAGAALVQILLGLPFLVSYPVAYISRAFNLGRVFVHFWSVNFKFIPEPIFISKGFAIFLLAAHLTLLASFAHYRWCKYVSMRLRFALLFSSYSTKFGKSSSSSIKVLTKEHVVTTMFVGNFIGIVCARSLHYQFYSWYFFSLPYMLWITHYPTFVRLILFVGVEYCWNVYPSNSFSSALLLFLHLIILWGLCSAPPQYPYAQDKSSSHKEK